MVLYVPGARGAGWTSNFQDYSIGASTAAPFSKTLVTTGVSSANGSTVSMLAAIPWDVGLLTLVWSHNALTITDTRAMFDVLIDRAGGSSWDTTNILVPNVICGFGSAPAVNSGGSRLTLPLFIPAGASIGVRSRTIGASSRSLNVGATAVAKHALPPGFKVGHNAHVVGAVTGNLNGTIVNSNNTWTDVGSTLASDLFGFSLLCGGPNSNSITAAAVVAEIGTASTPLQQSIYGLYFGNDFGYPVYDPSGPGVSQTIAEGTQMQVRVTSASSNNMGYAIYGVT